MLKLIRKCIRHTFSTRIVEPFTFTNYGFKPGEERKWRNSYMQVPSNISYH